MKKTFIALLLLSGTSAVWAQNTNTDSTRSTTTNTTTGMDSMQTTNPTGNSSGNMNNNDYNNQRSTNNNYNAYGTAVSVPAAVNMSFQKENPAATDVRWEQSNNWWRANYKNNGQDMNLYYGANGQSFAVALPVRQNLVPENVVDKARSMYGYNIYDIKTLKGTDTNYYQVRIMENGSMRTENIMEDGSAYVDTAMNNQNMMNSNSNGNGMNTNMNSNMNATTTDTTMHHNMDTTQHNMSGDTTHAMNQSMDAGSSTNTTNSTVNQGTNNSDTGTATMTSTDATLNNTSNSTNSSKKPVKKEK